MGLEYDVYFEDFQIKSSDGENTEKKDAETLHPQQPLCSQCNTLTRHKIHNFMLRSDSSKQRAVPFLS
jgi:hypothetical protein